jgi:hypothetical protein
MNSYDLTIIGPDQAADHLVGALVGHPSLPVGRLPGSVREIAKGGK